MANQSQARLLALLFCGSATADDGGKTNLLGIHDTILCFEWPTSHTMAVYAHIQDAPDGGRFQLTARGSASGRLVGSW